MPNFYDSVKETLQRMESAATDLEQKIASLETLVKDKMNQGTVMILALDPDWVRLNNAYAIRSKHTEWGRKLHGVAMGYTRELEGAYKNFLKGRPVDFKLADVTVGSKEKYAKAVQYKHTVSPEGAAVNAMIAKAANQLTGESGEKPLPGQRRIIDVMINDPANWWPFTDFRTIDSQLEFEQGQLRFDWVTETACIQILAQLSKYKKGQKGLNTTTVRSLHQWKIGHFPSRDSTTPKSTAVYAQGSRANTITVKIHYGQPRKFTANDGSLITVSKMVFQAHRDLFGDLKVFFDSRS